MGRTIVRPVSPARNRKSRDGLMLVALGIIVLFAVVGVVSAGVFAVSKLTSSSAPRAAHSQRGTGAAGLTDVQRAKAQATAIVRAAQAAGDSIIKTSTTKARKQAAAIIANAKRQAKTAQPPPAAAIQQPTAVANVQPVIPTAIPYGSAQAVGPTGGTSTGTGSAAGSGAITAPRSVPNLQGVPASWLVVGYSATFGSGPGPVGGVSVVNRGGKSFSGIVTVKYSRGGSAGSSFVGLAPGQSEVLPLSGTPYRSGGYQILVSVH